MEYRKIISDGDLVTMHKPWYYIPGVIGKEKIYRNLSEEVRLLKEHRDRALSKYLDLCKLHVIANKNVGDDLETLQILLLDNSDAYFEVDVDNSILEEREGVKYNFKGMHNKQGASSNNGQQKQQQQQKKKQQGKQVSLLEALTSAKLTVH